MKEIPGLPRYFVTRSGEIFSELTGKKKRLKKVVSKKGYEQVKLFTPSGKYSCFRVHRLVCITYLSNPENKPQVNHIDGNKLNNSLSNLEWCTQMENYTHARKAGLVHSPKWASNRRKRTYTSRVTKLTIEQVNEIRKIYVKKSITHDQLAERYKVSDTTIWKVLHFVTWKETAP